LYYHLNRTDDGIEMLLLNIIDKSEVFTIEKTDAVKQLREVLKEYFDKK
jgi:hypothetical protein